MFIADPIMKYPRACTTTRPTCVPLLRPRGTTARTKSPVKNLCVTDFALGLLLGNPYLSVRVMHREWRRCDLIRQKDMAGSSLTDRSAPILAASIQSALG